MSVTFQDFSYDMLPKKSFKILNFFFVKKKVCQLKFTCVNLATQTAHFLINYVFGHKICSKKRTSERKGESENIN